MRRTLPLLSLAVVLVLLIAGCSSSDSDSSASGSGSGSASGPANGSEAEVSQAQIDSLARQAGLSGKVNVESKLEAEPSGGAVETELDDFYFGPTFVKAEPGSTVKVELHNEGSLEHTFTIDSANIDETLQPDATKTVTVKVPSSGSLAYYCRFHQGQGMQGAFVTSGSS
jgi:plastocyanin